MCEHVIFRGEKPPTEILVAFKVLSWHARHKGRRAGGVLQQRFVCLSCGAVERTRIGDAPAHRCGGATLLLDPARVALFCASCGDYIHCRPLLNAVAGARSAPNADNDDACVTAATLCPEGPSPDAAALARAGVDLSAGAGAHSHRCVDPRDGTRALATPRMHPMGLRGINNLGNTCFMNSVLQCLLRAPLLRAFFLSGGHRRESCVVRARGASPCMACEVAALFSDAYSGDCSPLSPASLLRAWWAHLSGGSAMAVSGQQDAHEFQVMLMEAMEGAQMGHVADQGTLRPLCRFSPPQRDPTPIATTTAIANPTTTAPAPNTATPAPPRPLIGKLRIPMLGKRKAEGGEAGASNGAAAAGVTGGVAAASTQAAALPPAPNPAPPQQQQGGVAGLRAEFMRQLQKLAMLPPDQCESWVCQKVPEEKRNTVRAVIAALRRREEARRAEAARGMGGQSTLPPTDAATPAPAPAPDATPSPAPIPLANATSSAAPAHPPRHDRPSQPPPPLPGTSTSTGNPLPPPVQHASTPPPLGPAPHLSARPQMPGNAAPPAPMQAADGRAYHQTMHPLQGHANARHYMHDASGVPMDAYRVMQGPPPQLQAQQLPYAHYHAMAQAHAHAHAHAQAHANAQVQMQSQAHAHAHAQSQVQAHAQVQMQSHAQAHSQAQVHGMHPHAYAHGYPHAAFPAHHAHQGAPFAPNAPFLHHPHPAATQAHAWGHLPPHMHPHMHPHAFPPAPANPGWPHPSAAAAPRDPTPRLGLPGGAPASPAPPPHTAAAAGATPLRPYSISAIPEPLSDPHAVPSIDAAAFGHVRRVGPNGAPLGLLDRVFGGALWAETTCCGCGHVSRASQPFLDVGVDVVGAEEGDTWQSASPVDDNADMGAGMGADMGGVEMGETGGWGAEGDGADTEGAESRAVGGEGEESSGGSGVRGMQIVDGDATPVVGTEEDVEGTVGGRGSQGATQDMGRHDSGGNASGATGPLSTPPLAPTAPPPAHRHGRGKRARVEVPRMERCGKCRTCVQPSLKKGCLRNHSQRQAILRHASSPVASATATPTLTDPDAAPMPLPRDATPDASASTAYHTAHAAYTAHAHAHAATAAHAHANATPAPALPDWAGALDAPAATAAPASALPRCRDLSAVQPLSVVNGGVVGPNTTARSAPPRASRTGNGGLGTAVRLSDCLARMVAPETIGVSEPWTCGGCGRAQRATRQVSLRRLPPVLCLHVKRFQHMGRRSQALKLDTHVAFHATLDLSPLVAPRVRAAAMGVGGGSGTGEWTYDLFGVVCHSGTMQGGHYVSLVKSGGRWYKCDDAWVAEVPEEAVLASQAYLLYYKHAALRGRDD